MTLASDCCSLAGMNAHPIVHPLMVLACAVLFACDREADSEPSAADDTLAGGDLALPPSASAPRPALPGTGPDTVRPAEVPTGDTLGASGETVGPVPPPVLDVGAVVNSYRRYYRELFVEEGSDVRGSVDPQLIEDAKRRTALDFGYVDVDAWNEMVSAMTPAQRSVLAQRVAESNRDLARELHGAQSPRS